MAGIFRGKYSAHRIFQTILVALLLVTMIGSAVSGVLLSKHLFSLFEFGGTSKAREIHMLCGYWNFVLMSLHIGIHWKMIISMVQKSIPAARPGIKWMFRMAEAAVALYGIFALVRRQIHEYLFGITKFAFIDDSEKLLLFLLDYVAMMGLFVFVAHYISSGLRRPL